MAKKSLPQKSLQANAMEIVVVDDEWRIISSIERQLKTEGYRVVGFTDPREFIQYDLTHTALILCDIHMPYMDGYTVFQKIKKHKAYQDIPFIFISGNLKSDQEIMETLGYDVDDLILKPSRPGEILGKVKNRLRKAEKNKMTLQALNALQMAREESLQVKEDMNSILASVCHDLRQPVANILGVTDMLEDSDLDQSQKELLDYIQYSGQIGIHIVTDLLEYSIAESEGRLTMNRHAFNIKDEMAKLQRLFFMALNVKNMKIHFKYGHDIPKQVFGDPNRISRVLYNLVNNAIKFSKKGGIIDIKIENHSKEDMRISVSDYGVGIAPKDLAVIFAPFKKANASRTTQSGGYGLGLAISKKMIEMMGGTIEVKSEVGKGSTFYFDLPLRRREKK
jgi:signal transduction histidine kinase